MAGRSGRDFKFMQANNIPISNITTLKREMDGNFPRIKSDILDIKNEFNNAFSNLANHLETSDNTFSIDNVNKLAESYSKCVEKLNFTLNCINQNADLIKLAGSYASILRPIFEAKYSDNSISADGYVALANTLVQCYTYFFEPNKLLDEQSAYLVSDIYNIDSAYLNTIFQNVFDNFNKMLTENPNQKIFYLINWYNYTDGIKISFNLIVPDILDDTKWIRILSGFNLTPKIPDYTIVSQLPSSYINYLQNMQNALNTFNKPSYDPTL